MVISIHQPEHMPYLGYFNKMSRCDKYVILDDVQFTKNSFQNRNKIIDKNSKEIWLTVPVEIKNHTLSTIKDIKIANINKWQKKYVKTLEQTYSKHQFFDTYMDRIKNIILKDNKYLIDLNMDIINFFREALKINTEIVFSSTLNIQSLKSDRVIDICKTLHAKEYLSGNGAKEYLDEKSFNDNEIILSYQDYTHPVYQSNNFQPYLSTIDLLMNCGPQSENIVKEF